MLAHHFFYFFASQRMRKYALMLRMHVFIFSNVVGGRESSVVFTERIQTQSTAFGPCLAATTPEDGQFCSSQLVATEWDLQWTLVI